MSICRRPRSPAIIIGGILFRPGPLYRRDGQAQDTRTLTRETEAGPALPA
jgi:hypothetical protein